MSSLRPTEQTMRQIGLCTDQNSPSLLQSLACFTESLIFLSVSLFDGHTLADRHYRHVDTLTSLSLRITVDSTVISLEINQ